MSKHISQKELSAYVDGEARDPRVVARHLQQCASCARRQVEMAKLSSHLQALEAAEVRPDFAQDVVRRVRQAGTRSPVPSWRRFAMPVAAAAAIVFATVFTALNTENATAPSSENLRAETPSPGAVEERAETVVIPEDEERIIARLENLVAENTESERIVRESFAGSREPLLPSTDEALLALANSEWFDEFARQWDGGRDYEVTLASMDAAETETLIELLGSYAGNGETL